MKKIIAKVFPYQDTNINCKDDIIFTNMWKIVPNFSKSESKQFFFFNVEINSQVSQVWINIKDVNDVYKLWQFLINQDYNKKFDIEKDFIATLNEENLINLIKFLKQTKIEYNLLLTPIFAFRKDKENIVNKKTEVFFESKVFSSFILNNNNLTWYNKIVKETLKDRTKRQEIISNQYFNTLIQISNKYIKLVNKDKTFIYDDLIALLLNNINEIKSWNGKLFINEKIVNSNNLQINEDIEQIQIVLNIDKEEKKNIEAINILTTTFKQLPNILWNIWNSNYQLFAIDNGINNNKNLFFDSKIKWADIKLPKFDFKDEQFDSFIQNYSEEYNNFIKIYDKKNKQEETFVRNVVYFKYVMLNTLEYYFNTLWIKIDKEDFTWLVFDTLFLDLAIDLKQPEYIENLEIFNHHLLETYLNTKSEYNKTIEKYWNKTVKINWNSFTFKQYLDKILYEFTVLYYTWYINYLLIVMDYILWWKKNNILIWPWRWSAAGSLLVFLLQITNIDPIPYDLMFERFLNPARVSPPDIDVDFEDEYRSAVLAYTQQKYWIDKVFKIWTFATLWLKSAFAQSWMYYKFDPQKRLKIQNVIEDFQDDILTEDVDKDLLDKLVEASNIFVKEDEKDILRKILVSINNINKKVINVWLHACGVIISPYTFNFTYNIYEEKDRKYLNKMYDMFPEDFMNKIIKDGSHETIKATLIEWPDLEGIVWLLKFDFLWLSTLSLIKRTVELINEKENKNINTLSFIDEITFNKIDDQKTFEIFQKWFTTGVFQFESGGMKKFLKQLKPTNIEDIIAMNALYRPWPIWFIPLFIKRKWTKDIDKLNILNLYFEAKEIFSAEIKKSFYKYLFDITILDWIIWLDKIMEKEKKYRKFIEKMFEEWVLEQENSVIIYKWTFFTYLKDKLVESSSILNNYWYEFKKKELVDFMDEYNLWEVLSKLEKKYYTFLNKFQKTKFRDIIQLIEEQQWENSKEIDPENILWKFFNEKETRLLMISYQKIFLPLLSNNYQISFLDKNLEKDLIKQYWKKEIDIQIKKLNKLYSITEQTYWIFVYQEQLMNLSKILAWFSSNDADWLRKIIWKKKLDKIPALKKDFVKGCVEKNNVIKEIAEYLFDAIIKPAGEYAFNKSHAAAYSSVAFITAYLKRYYPEAFLTALMDINLSKWSVEKEVDNTKVFNWIRDITLANEIWLYPNKKFTIKNYSLSNIKPAADYNKKEKNIDWNKIEEIDIYLNTKWYIWLSTKFLEKIEEYKKDWNKLTNIYDLIKNKVANKKETSAIFNSLYFDTTNLDYILTKNQIKKIKEDAKLLYNNLWNINIKEYFIEYLLCHYIFSDKEDYTLFFTRITEYIKKFEKELDKKNGGYSNSWTLFWMDDFGIDDNMVEEEIEKELLKKEKTNFREIIEKRIIEIEKLITDNKYNVKYVILQLLINNITTTFQFNKIDYLITKKTWFINNLYPSLDDVNNFYLLLNSVKTNRWQDFMIKYLSADLSNVKKKTFTKTKYNIEYFNSMVLNKWKLSYRLWDWYMVI